MLLLLFRALNAVFAVVVAVLVSLHWGDTPAAKLLTVVITASVVAFAEWLLIWAPKHSRKARRLLDPRAIFAGVWVQEDVHAFGDTRVEQSNRFAVFTVDYREPTDTYVVDGTAYNAQGREHARYWSVDTMHFAKDGRAMTYLFEGTIATPDLAEGDPRRTGLARLTLSSDDAGRGRVEHVAMNRTLAFNIRRITKTWLAEQELNRFVPEKLREPDVRDAFANAFARPQETRAATS